jgi:hypothetical protein
VRRCLDCLDLTGYGARELLHTAVETAFPSQFPRLISEIFATAQITITSLMDEYFSTFHQHLPILSEDAFRSRLVSWPQNCSDGLAILIWALYHITRKPCPDNDHSMCSLSYQTNKQIFLLQASKSQTLELLQAGLLITYYECGHGLPREAHMTLATCVTIARLMGLELDETSGRPCVDDESLACQWAIILLDRYVIATPVGNLLVTSEAER